MKSHLNKAMAKKLKLLSITVHAPKHLSNIFLATHTVTVHKATRKRSQFIVRKGMQWQTERQRSANNELT